MTGRKTTSEHHTPWNKFSETQFAFQKNLDFERSKLTEKLKSQTEEKEDPHDMPRAYLASRVGGPKHGPQRNLRLTEPDIPTYDTVHGHRSVAHVVTNRIKRLQRRN